MLAAAIGTTLVRAEEPPTTDAAPQAEESVEAATAQFKQTVQPLLAKFCYDCHGADAQEGGVRLDQLNPDMVAGHDAEHWNAALDMINQGYMPPDYNDQPTDAERRALVDWMTSTIELARHVNSAQPQADIRRLTREQYSNSLASLLNLPINFGKNLPDEAKSKMGFANSGNALVTSALHVEYYQAIAREALDKAIATGKRPAEHHYRVTLGKDVGSSGQAAVIGGFQSAPIPRNDVLVEVLDAEGQPRAPQSDDEGKALNEIERNVGIGMRGSSGDRYRIVDNGLLLFSALPHKEQAPKSWQGPSPNMKMLLRRCFPSEGPFVTRVVASLAGSEYGETKEELLQLRSDQPVAKLNEQADAADPPQGAIVLLATECTKHDAMQLAGANLAPVDITKPSSAEFEFTLPEPGLYHIDLVHPPAAANAMPSVSLEVDNMAQHLRVAASENLQPAATVTPLAHARLAAGKHRLKVGGKFFVGVRQVVIAPLPNEHPAAQSLAEEATLREQQAAGESAALRAFLGNRTDDGMEYAEYDRPQVVNNPPESPATYEFHGYLENLPVPMLDDREKTSLSNIMIVGVWNDHLVKKAADRGVPVLIKSIEFQGPYYPVWPPQSHTAIFFDSPLRETDELAYTRELLKRFITKAFRQDVSESELARYVDFWQAIRPDFDDYHQSVKEVLVAVLCSPRFLYLSLPESDNADTVLAERLAYFLWNSPPDAELAELAAAGTLRSQLRQQTERMVGDAKIDHFVDAFTYDWLRLDRHATMNVNVNQYPDYTRFIKRDMALETQHFVKHVLQNNLSVMTFIDSDFALLNQNLAEFYGIAGVEGTHFRPVPVTPDMHRGGLLSQGAFLTGHSDGTQAHPIKRAVWLKAKILGSPPPPPPPNVPALDPETPGFQNLTLKQQLELHRDKASCADCHRKIDPYGVVFENYDAVGRFQTMAKGRPVDSRSELPDGTVITGIDELKTYLAEQQSEAVVRSVVKHLYAYALGRDTTFADDPAIDTIVERVIADDYRLQTALVGIVESPAFAGTPTGIASNNK